jgi:hypothetical protein
MSQTRIKLAPYLTGALWRVKAQDRTFILFNSLPIARREADEEDWTVIAPNWKVTNAAVSAEPKVNGGPRPQPDEFVLSNCDLSQ